MTNVSKRTYGYWPDGTPCVLADRQINTGNSPRIDGRLSLTANPGTIDKSHLVGFHWDRKSVQKPIDGSNNAFTYVAGRFTHVDNIAYNRLRGKLFKGSASLGVTLASWRQSWEMITHRLNYAKRALDRTYKTLRRDERALKSLKREREPLANQILETEFGWLPLLADIHAAFSTVCKDGVPSVWLTGRGRETVYMVVEPNNPWYTLRSVINGTISTSYSCKGTIANPNVWLLNRMGLINPATVIWDLVPWSFVVNMFVNVNSLLSSYTDWVGIDVTDHSITRTSRLLEEWSMSYRDGSGFTSSVVNSYAKRRSTGIPLRPKLEVKLPDLNWELALIASSLVVQRFQRLNSLIRVV